MRPRAKRRWPSFGQRGRRRAAADHSSPPADSRGPSFAGSIWVCLDVAEWAIALQAAWDLSERAALDLALARHQGERLPPSKTPRGIGWQARSVCFDISRR